MTMRRAAGYAAVFALLAAWFASAAGVIGQPGRTPRTFSRSRDAAATDAVAFDVQAQAERLRQRLATAPVPQQPARNPFVFYSRPAPVRAAPPPIEPPAAPPAPAIDPEPALTLIGIAEERKEKDVVRTALIAGPGEELLMVKAGQTLLGRYKVTAVGADAVELVELSSDRVRRLSLR